MLAVIYMKKTMELKEFTYLFLATLANNTKIINLRDQSVKTIKLPVDYKQIFSNIMYAGNGWDEEFSGFIDTNEYFNNHFAWETKFANCLKETLKEMNKAYKYDFVEDALFIEMRQSEVEAILSLFPNEKVRNTMDHFTNLLVDYIYTRDFAERYHDYRGSTSATIRDINHAKLLGKEVKPTVIRKR